MNSSRAAISPLCVFLALLAAIFIHDARAETAGAPWIGEPGVTISAKDLMALQSAAEQTGIPGPPRITHRHPRNTQPRITPPGALKAAQWPIPETTPLPREAVEPRAAPALGTSFLTTTRSEALTVPPDTMGGVSPSQVFVTLNGRFKLFDRAGNANAALNVDSDIFFASVRNNSITTDPRVRFDRLSQRWFITMLNEASTSNRIMLAVSSGPTINDASSFTLYQFQHDFGTATTDTDHGTFADYDTLGIDANNLYIGVSIFTKISGGTLKGASGFVINKAALIGGTLSITPFRHLSVANQSGIYTPQGVDNDDPNATEGYFIGPDNTVTNQLIMFRITGGASPTLSSPIILTVTDTGNSSLGGVPAMGSSVPIDDNDNRLFQASIRNGSLYTAQNLSVDTSGNGTRGGTRDGARWYEIINLTTIPTVRQSGTLFDSTANNARNFFYPTCAVNGQGHMALGCTVSGANERLDIAVTGRLAGDALGTLQAPVVAVPATGNYNASLSSATQRWGDFSMTVVDPADNMTFWTFQEYCSGTDIWGVRAIQLKAPPPAAPVSCSPSSIAPNAANVSITVTGDTSSGAGYYEPGVAFPNHLGAALNGTGITINSVTFVDAAHVVLNVTTVNATQGAHTLTITNPDGQSASAAGVLCVAPAGPANAVGLSVTGPTSVDANSAFMFQVSAVDACGNPVPTYTGTVHFTSTDPGGILPADYPFQASDNGTRMFMATLKQIGDVTITATDAPNSLTGNFLTNVTSGPQITARPTGTPNPGVAGVAVSFNVNATTTLPPLTYAWDFGDSTSGTGQSPTHTYAGAGTFTATVTITDANGGMAIAGVREAVTAAPVLVSGPTATPNPAGVGQSVAFNASATEAGGDTLSYAWDFGDGSTATGGAPTHVYASAQTFTATVTVSDTRGAKVSGSVDVTIKAPIVGIGNDSDGDGFSDSFEIAFGSNPNDPTSTPLNGQPVGTVTALTVKRLTTRLNFMKQGHDVIAVSGTLPIPVGFQIAGTKIAIDVSGISRLFQLNSAGVSKGSFVLSARTGAFSMRLLHGDFSQTLGQSGLGNQDVRDKLVTLTVTLLFNGGVYQTRQPQTYTAHLNRIGNSK